MLSKPKLPWSMNMEMKEKHTNPLFFWNPMKRVSRHPYRMSQNRNPSCPAVTIKFALSASLHFISSHSVTWIRKQREYKKEHALLERWNFYRNLLFFGRLLSPCHVQLWHYKDHFKKKDITWGKRTKQKTFPKTMTSKLTWRGES